MPNTTDAARVAIGAAFPRGATGLIVVLLAASLAGCAIYDIGRTEQLRTEDEQACEKSGYKPGTNQFVNCVQDHVLTRMPTPKPGK